MGIRCEVSRSTLADANEKRDWRIYADFAQVLIAEAKRLYAGDSFALELAETVYALDSTTIDLCLSLFPWAHFRRTKSAIKLHTVLDLRGNIPSFLRVTDGRTSDVSQLDELPLEAGAIYVMDRGYVDFARLYRLTLGQASFVVRAKKNLRFKRRYSHEVDRSTGLICDQTIVLVTARSLEGYPEPLRRVRSRDPETGKRITLLTNNFRLSAWEVAELYRCRWQVELFFKWIKQHLRIKGVLRHFGQCRQDADLDRDLHLRARCDSQEAPQNRTQSLHNATDPERQPLSENRAFTGILACKVANARGVNMQPVAVLRLITGR